MSFRTCLLTTACLAALAAATPAIAAETTPGPNAAVRHDIRADALIGQDVVNEQDERVGEVESVIIGPAGEVRAVVVGVGGFLGLGERRVALAWDALDIRDEGETVRVAATSDQLKAMSAYRYREESLRGTAYSDASFRTADGLNTKPERQEMRQSVDAEALLDAHGSARVSELIGMNVVNGDGEVVGDIEEILVTEKGAVQAVLGVGGFLGIGETRLIVDWSSLELRRSADQVQVRTALRADDVRELVTPSTAK